MGARMDPHGEREQESRLATEPAPARGLTRRQVLRGATALGGGAMLAALLAACGGQESTATTGASGAAGGGAGSTPGAAGGAPVVKREGAITMWGFGVEETNPRAFSRVEAFKREYPNIKLEIVPKIEDQKILTAAAAKQLPDLLWTGRDATASWAARGVLQPVDDLIARDKFDTGRFYEAALSEARYEGKLYGVPQFMTVRALYVNADALKEAGSDVGALNTGNWDQLVELGRGLTKRSGDKIDRWGFDAKLPPFFWLWGLGNGGNFASADAKKVSYNDPKVVEALDWGIKSYEAQGGYRSYQAVASTFQGDEQFARGLVAMTLYENWLLGIIARVAPDLNFAVLPMRKRGTNDQISFTGGNIWTIPTGAKDRDAAWEFIKFMSAESTWQIAEDAVKADQKKNNRPYIPTLTGDKNADKLAIEKVYEPIAPKFDEAVKLFPRLLEGSQKIPVSTSPVSKQLIDTLLNDGVKPSLNGERPAKEALDRANQKAQQEIDQFQPS